GAGYLQNVSERYPNYFREQMFHNLLVQRGYLVLDLDYRASEGYGRDWRTAIYRQMGHPELEDYLDGIDWLVEHRQADRERVGIYGGSYGGFMTFMALFRKPGTFKAGAALRPVTDWSQYNHSYTANILNTPDIDPEAYRKSSPIEYAEGLQDHRLIAHGMIDDNVFYRDSVVLAQRLIELRKDKWELASYPLERHAYQQSDSWYDQYRRILELFERTLKSVSGRFPGTGLTFRRQSRLRKPAGPARRVRGESVRPGWLFRGGLWATLVLRPRKIDPFFGARRVRGPCRGRRALSATVPRIRPPADSSSLSWLRRPAARGAAPDAGRRSAGGPRARLTGRNASCTRDA